MKIRLSPKYFRIRTTVLCTPLLTVGLLILTTGFISSYLSGEDSTDELLWPMIGVICLTAICFIFTIIAIQTYRERFWNGDKAVWKNSKWRFIKRFLLET